MKKVKIIIFFLNFLLFFKIIIIFFNKICLITITKINYVNLYIIY